MGYPTIEQYQEVLQNTRTAFVDPQLARGRIKTSGMLGTPQVVSGGFALTYAVEVDGTRFAVRCFHRPAGELEKRYAAVTRKLKQLQSRYFVEFEFQAKGVRANGGTFPIVKMAWATGVTLGEFVEANHANAGKLANLRTALSQLASDLERMGIAHGDIQEGNLMVADDGRRVQLIDYDGMFVPELASLGSSELGHRDYQHPRRDKTRYDVTLDRFSFISLDLALRALCERPSLWTTSQSGAGVIVFKANDFADPAASPTLAEVSRIPSLQRDAKHFASVCLGGFAEVPSLSDFQAGKNVPQQIVVLGGASQARAIGYLGQYDVVDGSDYAKFASCAGAIVELVGCVKGVRLGKTTHGKPMAFINLGKYPGCVSLTLWSDALATPGEKPSEEWVGRWISVRGLVQPPSPRQKHPAASIQVENLAQIVRLTEQEAKYRLAGPGPSAVPARGGSTPTAPSNAQRLAAMRSAPTGPAPARTSLASGQPHRPPAAPGPLSLASSPPPLTPASTQNQQVLANMRQAAAAASSGAGAGASGSTAGGAVSGAQLAPTPSVARQHAPVPPAKHNRRIPGWVWIGGLLLLVFLLRRMFG